MTVGTGVLLDRHDALLLLACESDAAAFDAYMAHLVRGTGLDALTLYDLAVDKAG